MVVPGLRDLKKVGASAHEEERIEGALRETENVAIAREEAVREGEASPKSHHARTGAQREECVVERDERYDDACGGSPEHRRGHDERVNADGAPALFNVLPPFFVGVLRDGRTKTAASLKGDIAMFDAAHTSLGGGKSFARSRSWGARLYSRNLALRMMYSPAKSTPINA